MHDTARHRSLSLTTPSCLSAEEQLPDSNVHVPVKPAKNTDDILKLLGDPGRFQIIQFTLLCCQFIPLAMSDLMPIFFSLNPTGLVFGSTAGSAHDPGNHSKVAAFQEVNNTGTRIIFQLHLFETADTCVAHGLDLDRSNHEFVYEQTRQASIVGDMNLICGRTWMIGFATTIYYLGQIVASPGSGWLADTYGRRPVLLVSNLLYTALSVGLIFSRDYTSFTILRFLIGMARQAMNTSFYVLMMEMVPPQRRITCAAVAQFPFSAGVLILGLAAYLLRNWRYIQIVVAASNCFAVGFIWFAPESLKWLIFQNKTKEAQSVYMAIAKFNGISVAPETLDNLRDIAGRMSGQQATAKTYSLLDCFKTFHIRNYTLLCCFIWTAILVQYFGLMLLLSHISGDIYTNYAISAALEVIPRILGLILTYKLDNRTTMMSYFLVGGSLALIAGIIPGTHYGAGTAKTVLTFLARMSVVGCFALAYTFTSELFPTPIRNAGFGLCSIAMRVGSMIAPQIASLEVISSFKGLPFVVIGGITLTAALATAMLPETKGINMVATVEEAEKLGDVSSWLGRARRLSLFALKTISQKVKKSESSTEIVDENFPLETIKQPSKPAV